MSNDTHEGWTNRETWALVLHIDNDQAWLEEVLEAIRNSAWDQSYEDYLGDQLPEHRESGAVISAGDYPIVATRETGELVKELSEDVLDPWSDKWGETGDSATIGVDLFRIIQDIGSLWRIDWDEVGRHYLQTLSEQ